MTRFKEALLDELVAYAQLPASTARTARARRIQVMRMGLASAGAGSLVAVAVAASVVGLTGEQAAYAVEKNDDGTVTVIFRELADATQATRDLRAAGVPAQVVQLAWPGTCATTPTGVPVPEQPRGTGVALSVRMPSEYLHPDGARHDWLSAIIVEPPSRRAKAFTFKPSAIPPDAELFILEVFSPQQGGLRVNPVLVKAPAPTCWEAGSVTITDRNGKVHTSPSAPVPTGRNSPSPSGWDWSPGGPDPSPGDPSPGDPSPGDPSPREPDPSPGDPSPRN